MDSKTAIIGIVTAASITTTSIVANIKPADYASEAEKPVIQYMINNGFLGDDGRITSDGVDVWQDLLNKRAYELMVKSGQKNINLGNWKPVQNLPVKLNAKLGDFTIPAEITIRDKKYTDSAFNLIKPIMLRKIEQANIKR